MDVSPWFFLAVIIHQNSDLSLRHLFHLFVTTFKWTDVLPKRTLYNGTGKV